MATCGVPVSISGVKTSGNFSSVSVNVVKPTVMAIQRKANSRNFSVRAEYNDRSGSDSDFVAGFLLGGAIFGTLGYIFAPQIRRSLLDENEHGFRKARLPAYYDQGLAKNPVKAYYDEGLEKTRETLSEKISQLNSAIDNVSTRLRGGKKVPEVPVESNAEEMYL
uniref:Uncharacterized protein n=1 Tax=Plantago major TaxID=29818 RepID=Q5ZF85_PLAMJ|nr:hypothetical protein [Plantago major]